MAEPVMGSQPLPPPQLTVLQGGTEQSFPSVSLISFPSFHSPTRGTADPSSLK